MSKIKKKNDCYRIINCKLHKTLQAALSYINRYEYTLHDEIPQHGRLWSNPGTLMTSVPQSLPFHGLWFLLEVSSTLQLPTELPTHTQLLRMEEMIA